MVRETGRRRGKEEEKKEKENKYSLWGFLEIVLHLKTELEVYLKSPVKKSIILSIQDKF